MRIIHLTQKSGDIRLQRAAYVLAKLGHVNICVMGLDYDPRNRGFRPFYEVVGPAECIIRTQLGARLTASQRGKLIAGLKPDLIICHEPLTMQSYADLPDVPIILDSHELNLHLPMNYDSPRRKEERDKILRRIMSDPRIVAHLTPSEDLVIELQREMRHTVDRWDVPTLAIHNGAPTLPVDYRPRTLDTWDWLVKGNARDGGLVEGDEKWVVFCGNLTADRRPDLLIGTLAELQRRDQRWTGLVLSRANMVESHIIEPLTALGTLFLELVSYPWPWHVADPDSDPTVLDVVSLGAIGFSFAEIAHASWRGACPNKATDYSGAGVYQVADACTWLSGNLGGAGRAMPEDPVKLADLAEQLDSSRPSYESVSEFARHYACDGPVDLPNWKSALRCAR